MSEPKQSGGPDQEPARPMPDEVKTEIVGLVASAVAETLKSMGIAASAGHAPAGPVELRPQDDPTFEEGPPQKRHAFRVELLGRHAEWIERVAALYNMDPATVLERLVRKAYADDPTKGGTILVSLPTDMGQPASSALRSR